MDFKDMVKEKKEMIYNYYLCVNISCPDIFNELALKIY